MTEVFHSNLEDVARIIKTEIETYGIQIPVLRGEMRAEGASVFALSLSLSTPLTQLQLITWLT